MSTGISETDNDNTALVRDADAVDALSAEVAASALPEPVAAEASFGEAAQVART